MPRKPRVQFPGAIDHIVTRGDGRQNLFHDDGHYQRLTEGWEAEVLHSEGRELAASLCRELTNASLVELSAAFGLAHPARSANLVKKAKRLISASKKYKSNYSKANEKLLKTENQV